MKSESDLPNHDEAKSINQIRTSGAGIMIAVVATGPCLCFKNNVYQGIKTQKGLVPFSRLYVLLG